MSSDVVLSAALRSNLLSLQSTQKSIDQTQLRLATGLKVNSALDNPQSFFTSQTLNNRASDLSRLLDGISLSVRTIQEADKGVTALTSLVNQAQSIAQSALSAQQNANGFATLTSTKDLSGVGDLVDPSTGILTTANTFKISIRTASGTSLTSGDIAVTDATTIDAVAGNINASTASPYVKATVNNGKLVITSKAEGTLVRLTQGGSNPITAAGFAYLGLDGYVGTENTAATTRTAGTVIAGTRTISSLASANNANTVINGKFVSTATLNQAGFSSSFAIASNDSFGVSLTIDGTTTVIGTGYGDTTTIQKVIDDVNVAGLGVTAAYDATTGKIGLTFADTVGSAQIKLVSGSAGAGTTAFGFGTGASDSTLAATNIASEQFTFTSGSADTASLASDYNKVRSQIDNLVEDANFRGVNLLGGDNLTTYFNENRSNSLTTSGVDFTSTGLGISAAAFTTTTAINTSLTQLDSALTKVRNFGSSISNDLAIIQTRQDFTSSTIDTLKAGASDLTAADQNEEGANLLALQTRQQLGVTALSLAAQSQQSVLRLF